MSNLCCRLCTLCCNEDNISDANLQVVNQQDEVVNILHAGGAKLRPMYHPKSIIRVMTSPCMATFTRCVI